MNQSKYFRSLDGVTAIGAGATWNPTNKENLDWLLCQVEIVTTATVDIEGRLAPDMPWVVLKTFTASGAERISGFPEMRANCSDWTAGAVTADFYG